jgi:hypothetical protein
LPQRLRHSGEENRIVIDKEDVSADFHARLPRKTSEGTP